MQVTTGKQATSNGVRLDSALSEFVIKKVFSSSDCRLELNEEESFLDDALYHGLQPLLYDRLQKAGAFSELSEEGRATLKQQFALQSALKSLLEREIKQVLANLNDAGIRPLMMKGAPLSYTHYDSPTLRPHGDTDLLIRPKEAQAVDRVMTEMGFSRLDGVSGELIKHQAAYTRMATRKIGVHFDFHWKISNRNLFAEALSYDEAQSRSIAVPALGEHARSFGPLDALLFACLHLVGHHNEDKRLIWLYDIHLLFGSLSDDERDRFLKLADQKQVKAICLSCIVSAREWFDTEISNDLIADYERCMKADFIEPSKPYLESRKLARLILEFKHLDGKRRIKLLKEYTLPAPDYMLKWYGASSRLLLPALYAHRVATRLWRLLKTTV